MQIVINISDELYKEAKEQDVPFEHLIPLCRSIENGMPLPKGHGKLVDISKIDKDRIESDNPVIYLTMNGQCTEAVSLDYLNSLPTIIEADKEE